MSTTYSSRPRGRFLRLPGTWMLLALLVLLIAWKSYPLLFSGFEVQQLWSVGDYLGAYLQDFVLWLLLALLWGAILWRQGRVGLVVFVVLCHLVLLFQVIDQRMKLLFLQPLSLHMIGFGVDEFDYLSSQAHLFLGNRYWKGVLLSFLVLVASLGIPWLWRRSRRALAGVVGPDAVAAVGRSGASASIAGPPPPRPLLAGLALLFAIGVAGMFLTVPKAYGLHQNFFVDIVTGAFEGEIPGVYDHVGRPTETPVRIAGAEDYAHTEAPALAVARGMNVVLYVLESTSWQRTSLGGGTPERTPFLAELVRRGALAAPCYAHFAASTQSTFVLLSGLYASPTKEILSTQLREISGLVRVLKSSGYHTELVSAQNLNFQGTRYQFERMGYDAVLGSQDLAAIAADQGLEYVADGRGSADDRYMFLRGFEHLVAKQPFLATYYTTSSHYPYEFPGCQPGSDEHRHLQSLTYSDRVLEELFGHLTRHGLAGNTMVVVTSDHGEHFHNGEFKGRGTALSKLAHLVPLVVYVPGADLGSHEIGNARHVDVTPTLLDLLGIADTTLPLQGRSLFADRRQLPVQIYSIGVERRAALVENGHKILHDFDSGSTWIADLGADATGATIAPLEGDAAADVVRRLTECAEYNEAYLRDLLRAQAVE